MVLTGELGSGAGKHDSYWEASIRFLAYIDAAGKLQSREGRVTWPLTDEEIKEHSSGWPYNFGKFAMYRLLVRKIDTRTMPEGLVPSAYNSFMIVNVLEENAENEQLLAVLEEFKRPVVIEDEVLGKLTLNKSFGTFEGDIYWLGEDVSVSLEVDAQNEETWPVAVGILKELFKQSEIKDSEFRSFAADELTELANDWLDDDGEEISAGDFRKRISISELTVSHDGSFTAYYNDDDMFYGHIIMIEGSIAEGLTDAYIAG